jgi:colicin import membrane protein
MHWLLKFDGYPPGVVFALLLHGLILYILLPSRPDPAAFVKVDRPSVIVASVIKQNPQKLRQIQRLETQRRNDEEAQRRARDQARAAAERQARETAAREAQQVEAERQRQADAEKRRQAEAQRVALEQAAEDARRRSAEEAVREQERQRQLAREQAAREAAALQAAQQAAEALSTEQQLVAQYTAIIIDLISNNWILPPNARNGMVVMIELQLVPTGEIVNSRITQSSGDQTFDRSALQAVARVESFPELRDMPTPIFERNFRNFSLEFRPEDLLR